MKITGIVQQAKRPDRYSILIDGQFSFSLSQTGLLESGLIKGQELSQAEIAVWKKRSAEDKINSNAFRYAALRLRSQWEMETYLKRKEASPALTSKILNKLTKIDLINDYTFAKNWIANRRLLRPTSKRKLQQELRAKHISRDLIDELLEADSTDELDALKQIIDKKRQLPKYQDKLKLMQYLARQGFSYDDIKTAISRE